MMDIRKWFLQGTTAASDQSGGEGEKPATEANAAEPTLITEAEAPEPSSKGTCTTVMPPGDIGDNHSEEGPTATETESSSSTTKILQAPTPPLPLGILDVMDARGEGGSGLSLVMLDYTLRKDKELDSASSTIPRNATYTSHDIQNEIIGLMSEVVTEEIMKEIGDSWYTLKVDGTKDPTGCENISIVLSYVGENNHVCERLLSMATSKECDALSLINLVPSELTNVGLSTEKILSQ
ncbi:UNVERIFIED_CONTAM: hypothetical protein FKN15_075844 [Acipenser sinensis]